MAMAQDPNTAIATTVAPPDGSTILLDLGPKSRKQVKRLRRGRGRLMVRVQDTIAQLREAGELGESSEVVIVVVKQQRKSRGWFS